MGVLGLTFASGMHLNWRPLPGTAPWHTPDEKITVSHWVKPKDYPFNYTVPNYGEYDIDIFDSLENTKKAEKKAGRPMYRELFYPNGTTIPESAKIILPDPKKEVDDLYAKPPKSKKNETSLGKDEEVKQALMSLAETEKE